MTIYGGEETYYGVNKYGFFVNCTKCGWHSKTEIYVDGPVVVFKCHHCGNKHTEEADA
jgi:translation initiation factor 2 beta subunit (eIF-2beta)/eIF-5